MSGLCAARDTSDRDSYSPYTDLQSWVSLSQTLEHVGAAAYMGASRFVDDKDVLAASVVSLFPGLEQKCTCSSVATSYSVDIAY